MVRRFASSLALMLLAYGCAQGQSAEDGSDGSGNPTSTQGTSAGGGTASAGTSGSGGASQAGGTQAGGGGAKAGEGSVGGKESGGAAGASSGGAGASGKANGGTAGTSNGGASQGGASLGGQAAAGESLAGHAQAGQAQAGHAQAGQASGGTPGTGGAQGGAAGTTANPCQGVTCNAPPANVCVDANTLGVYSSSGTCDAGKCSYAETMTACTMGCANGQCAGDPCGGITCNTPPASVCADSSHLQVSDVPGTCAAGNCSYGSHLAFCAFGCSNGVCDGDPCKGMTCSTPPVSYCGDASNLVVYTAPGTCAAGVCSYTSQMQFCSFGCVNGGCTNDPCAGKSCTTPPASYCTNATTLRTFTPSGTCAAGMCSYPQTDSPCAHGCANGKCEDCSVDADCAAGKYCNAGSCSVCTVDQHCGSACTDCALSSEVCDKAGDACVQCLVDSDCGSGKWCSTGTCTACADNAHCGASCGACSGKTPTCAAGACTCSGTSCGTNIACNAGVCADPCTGVLLTDDFESGAEGFTHDPTDGNASDDPPWQLGTPKGLTCHSGKQCWGTVLDKSGYGDCQTAELKSPAIDLSACATSPLTVTLTFWHWYQFEPKSANTWWDGGTLQISKDGGKTWDDTTPTPAYQGTIKGAYDDCTPTPMISGHAGWSGLIPSNPAWTQVSFDIPAAYHVASFQARWLFGTDESTDSVGWFVDDFVITPH